MTLMAL